MMPGTATPTTSAAASLWVASAATNPSSAVTTRALDGLSSARSTSHSALNATVIPKPCLTNSIDRYCDAASCDASTAATKPAPRLRPSRAPTPNAGNATSAPPIAAPSLAPVIGSVAYANGSMNQNVSGEAGYWSAWCSSSERSWIG
jgi:hypothetical protein